MPVTENSLQTPPAAHLAYLAYRCPRCGSDECGNDATAGWDVVTQASVLLGEFDDQWCCECGEIKLEEYTITDPIEIARIDAERAKLVATAAAHALLDAARWASSALSDWHTARAKGYDAIAAEKLLNAIALAEGRAAS